MHTDKLKPFLGTPPKSWLAVVNDIQQDATSEVENDNLPVTPIVRDDASHQLEISDQPYGVPLQQANCTQNTSRNSDTELIIDSRDTSSYGISPESTANTRPQRSKRRPRYLADFVQYYSSDSM